MKWLVALLMFVSVNVFANDVLWEEKANGHRIVARDTTFLVCNAINNSQQKGVERLCFQGPIADGITPEQFAARQGYDKIDRVGLLREGGTFFWVIVVFKR